ncbi:MAG: DASS family sodium-coupled anion symporter [bacterium]|nr:DASS family sodium-coupled anion symporter [bacterium]
MTATDTKTSESASTRRRVGLGVGLVAFVLPLLIDIPDLSEAGERVLAVFLLAIVLWVTEAIPLYATAALVILLEIVMVSDQAVVGLPDGLAVPEYRTFFNALAHPVLMLFLGGFFLARGSSKYRLDRALAGVLLKPFGDRPAMIMLGLMLITAGFSMFMSNMATTATMIAVVLPVVAKLDPADRLRPALILSIPVAANIGGMGTPVGTPPNAIAVGQLASAGIEVSFAKWMALAVPGVVVLLLVAWWLMGRAFPTVTESIDLGMKADFDRSNAAKIFYVTFAVTVALWLTEAVHGLPSGVTGFLPVVVLLATGLFGAEDLRRVQWDVLWLVAGGIALGVGVAQSGLDEWLVGRVAWENFGSIAIVALLAAVALVLSTVISNSAAANLLVPLGLSMALSPAVDVDPLLAGFFIAIGASLAMALPISTPTNAVAYSTGEVSTRDMARVGLIVGAVGLVVFLLSPLFWSAVGLT